MSDGEWKFFAFTDDGIYPSTSFSVLNEMAALINFLDIFITIPSDNFHVTRVHACCRVPVIRVLLTYTKVPRSTKQLVARVKVKCEKVSDLQNDH